MTDPSGRKAPATGARGGLGAAIARELAVRSAFGIRCFALSNCVNDTAMQRAIRASGTNRISGVPRDRLPGPAAPVEVATWLVPGEANALAGTMVRTGDQAVRQVAGRGN